MGHHRSEEGEEVNTYAKSARLCPEKIISGSRRGEEAKLKKKKWDGNPLREMNRQRKKGGIQGPVKSYYEIGAS